MATAKPCVTTAGELIRKFWHFSEIAQDAPVVITKDGHPHNVLISIEEYERLKTRDQQAFLAADTPDEFLSEIEALASGEGDQQRAGAEILSGTVTPLLQIDEIDMRL
jgi:PHD/YefM family antitoxin component YafN of YafNO toxin-antitoxin module